MFARFVSLVYRETVVGSVRIDLIVGEQVVVEVKSVEQLASVHHEQVLSVMRAASLRAGVLVNFNVAVLPTA